MKYAGVGLSYENAYPKIAIIDSGNTSIQLPAKMFAQFEQILVTSDPTIKKQTVDSTTILVSSKSCYYLRSVYGLLRFKLGDTEIKIRPEGYLYNLPNQDDCFIGIQKLPEN